MNMRAAIYTRYSTEKQKKQDSVTINTTTDQIRVCTEHAERQGLTVELTFSDEGISGAATGNRPGFLAMMEAAAAHHFDVLIVVDLTRL
jgi:DNA invertase Pin-like site-specific DNA recombinase